MRNKQSGASIAQYAIVILCVAAGLVAVFSGLGHQVVNILTQYTNSYSAMSTNASQNLNDNIASANIIIDQTNATADMSKLPVTSTTTSSPGTTSQIASTSNVSSTPSSSSGDTSIDYGSYVNNGIANTYDPTVTSTTTNNTTTNTTPTSTTTSDPVTVATTSTGTEQAVSDPEPPAGLFGGIIGTILGVVTSVINVVTPISSALGGVFDAIGGN